MDLKGSDSYKAVAVELKGPDSYKVPAAVAMELSRPNSHYNSHKAPGSHVAVAASGVDKELNSSLVPEVRQPSLYSNSHKASSVVVVATTRVN